MARRIISGLMIIFAYVIPMMVGSFAGCLTAWWLFVPLAFSLLIWGTGDEDSSYWTSFFVLILGITVAVLVGVTSNFVILWASVVILFTHFLLMLSGVFQSPADPLD